MKDLKITSSFSNIKENFHIFTFANVFPYTIGSLVKLPPKRKVSVHSYCSFHLMGQKWLNYTDMRDRCHVLEGVINHQRCPKSPQNLFWRPSTNTVHSVSTDSVKLASGVVPGCSHVNLNICQRTELFTPQASPITNWSRLWPSFWPMDI